MLGLLGPNGAGKTTTMRMVMGLITPDRRRGPRVRPAGPSRVHPSLARVGCFVEGPGFLPHLTGRQNLDLYWRASGRTGDDPRFDEVLEIADLGGAIDQRVRTYSQGMRQRLGIAQAMLGMPDLLMLDEPTNGLDPPQIKEMREVVQRLRARPAAPSSSPRTCSARSSRPARDVVVMHRGRLIGAAAPWPTCSRATAAAGSRTSSSRSSATTSPS